MDLTQAEAVADLIRSKTDQAQAAALAQLQGHLAAEVRSLRNDLLPLLAHIEVGLDHSDEDHAFLRREEFLKKCGRSQAALDQILASARLGKILREGLRIAIVGRPNVGKSSLLNALLREERAIVTPIPGTTRDTLEESVDWDGIPVVLTDTAGLRSGSSDLAERLGMERTRQAVAQADWVIGVFDGSAPSTPEDRQVMEACLPKPHVWAINKIDLPSRWDSGAFSGPYGQAPVAPLSAKTGVGLDRLVQWVKTLALKETSSTGQAQWLLNARHRAALERARDALRRAREAAQSEAFEECVALEIQSALQALGEIIGETATEDLLDQIFSQFCVGK
jgi:tRNA modification GTPase